MLSSSKIHRPAIRSRALYFAVIGPERKSNESSSSRISSESMASDEMKSPVIRPNDTRAPGRTFPSTNFWIRLRMNRSTSDGSSWRTGDGVSAAVAREPPTARARSTRGARI